MRGAGNANRTPKFQRRLLMKLYFSGQVMVRTACAHPSGESSRQPRILSPERTPASSTTRSSRQVVISSGNCSLFGNDSAFVFFTNDIFYDSRDHEDRRTEAGTDDA